MCVCVGKTSLCVPGESSWQESGGLRLQGCGVHGQGTLAWEQDTSLHGECGYRGLWFTLFSSLNIFLELLKVNKILYL